MGDSDVHMEDVENQPPADVSQTSAVGPAQANYQPPVLLPQTMHPNMSLQSEGEAKADGEIQGMEISVDGDMSNLSILSNQHTPLLGTVFTTGYFSGVGDTTQAPNHSNQPPDLINFQDSSILAAVRQQPSPYNSQPLGHQPSGDTWQQRNVSKGHSSHSTQGGALNSAPDQTSELLGQTQKAMGFPDGATGMSSQDQDKMKTSEVGMQDLQQSTDKAEVLVEIKCSLKEQPQRWDRVLQKTLQSFFNKGFPSGTEICDLQILPSTPSSAVSAKVIISPSSACEILITKKSVSLTLKDINEEATVHFEKAPLETPPIAATRTKYGTSGQKTQGIPMTVSAVVDVKKFESQLVNGLGKLEKYRTGPDTLKVMGTFEEVEEFYKEFHQVVGQPVTSNANYVSEHTNPTRMETSQETMTVPLYQYWYLNHMHRREIESIQEKHGVTIKADVSVSVEKTHGAHRNSFTDASREFQELFLKCTSDIHSVSVPSVIELVKNIQSFDAKLMLNASAKNWSLVGPRDQVAAAQISLNLPANEDNPKSERFEKGHQDSAQNKNQFGESRWNAPKDIKMDIKDPVLSNGLCVSEIHWELMKNAFKKQIKDLKNKFGVEFQETNMHGKATIRAQSAGDQKVNLEVNALRALMSLHQKTVMMTMCCPLQNASHQQAEMLNRYLADLCKQNSSLVVREGSATNGVWMMVGFPEHLRFAVSEIEKRCGGAVFDKKHKEMIGYEKNAEFLSPFTDGLAWEGPKRYEGGDGMGDGAASRDAVYVYRKASQADSEIGTGGQRAFGSSVDGPVSSGLDEEDGQKTGGAGRMEASGSGNHKEWEKGPASKERQNGDPRSLSGGADGGGTSEEDNCPICMDEFINKEKLPCGHGFCKDCLRRSLESMGATCPICKKIFGKVEGDQPEGKMTDYIQRSPLPGFKQCDTIVINYDIPSGTQSSKHPKPGRSFQGAQRTAYLPDNREGREVLALLRKAFDQRLIFTVGTSRTSGRDDCVTWNDVHHKTNTHGGAPNFGYPDDDYLKRVRDELKAKGIE